jgi:hypothetical protein
MSKNGFGAVNFKQKNRRLDDGSVIHKNEFHSLELKIHILIKFTPCMWYLWFYTKMTESQIIHWNTIPS